MRSLWVVFLLIAVTFGGIWLMKNQPGSPLPDSSIASSAKFSEEIREGEEIHMGQASPQRKSAADLQFEAHRKIQILDQIFKAKNDNDPRLDQEFRFLSSIDKIALESKYNELKAEALNEKGTIVFLLGRNLSKPEDFEFIKKVVREPVCLSLSNCLEASSERSTTLQETGTEITLSYPQIVGIKALEKYLDSHASNHPGYNDARSALQDAMNSTSPMIRSLAKTILNNKVKTQKNR